MGSIPFVQLVMKGENWRRMMQNCPATTGKWSVVCFQGPKLLHAHLRMWSGRATLGGMKMNKLYRNIWSWGGEDIKEPTVTEKSGGVWVA